MKKLYGFLIGCMALAGLSSCSEETFMENYIDPSVASSVSCDKLMNGIFYTGNTWLNPVYYRYYVQSTTSGAFSQIIGSTNSRQRYAGAGVGYFNTRWQNFYNLFTQYVLLKTTYEELSEDEQDDNKVFYIIGRSVMQQQLSEVLSLWGDVPYSEAGTLWYTGSIDASKPAYDDDVDIYESILDDLDEANTYLGSVSLSSVASSALTVQDYVCGGDVELWQRYVNSLRLRIAIHLATNGDLTSTAQSAIATMLNNPSTYPMVESYDQMPTVQADTEDFQFASDLQSAIENSSYNRASGAILRALGVADDGTYEDADPRLEILYDSNWNDEYIGLDPTEDVSDQETNMNLQGTDSETGNVIGNGKYYAAVDTATFTRNSSLFGVWMTAAEVAFSKAEAYAMGYGVSKNLTTAKEYFIEGMKLSTEFYFNLNSTATYRTPADAPDDDVVEAYAESQWDADNAQECIITQKWLNFFIYNELEAWNCVRRTGYPSLQFKYDSSSTAYPIVPERLIYPSDETQYNADNYNAATSNGTTDTYYTQLFWMADTWYSTLEDD